MEKHSPHGLVAVCITLKHSYFAELVSKNIHVQSCLMLNVNMSEYCNELVHTILSNCNFLLFEVENSREDKSICTIGISFRLILSFFPKCYICVFRCEKTRWQLEHGRG